jgi:hypothetical protein
MEKEYVKVCERKEKMAGVWRKWKQDNAQYDGMIAETHAPGPLSCLIASFFFATFLLAVTTLLSPFTVVSTITGAANGKWVR